jgi:hypothetical protein
VWPRGKERRKGEGREDRGKEEKTEGTPTFFIVILSL